MLFSTSEIIPRQIDGVTIGSCAFRCRNRSRIAHPSETNPIEQLEVVGNFISDLGAIIKQYKSEHQKKMPKHED